MRNQIPTAMSPVNGAMFSSLERVNDRVTCPWATIPFLHLTFARAYPCMATQKVPKQPCQSPGSFDPIFLQTRIVAWGDQNLEIFEASRRLGSRDQVGTEQPESNINLLSKEANKINPLIWKSRFATKFLCELAQHHSESVPQRITPCLSFKPLAAVRP